MSPEALKSQLDQGEEKTSKMKQLLVKTKKDLADAKKEVCLCQCMCACCVCHARLLDCLLLCTVLQQYCLMNVNCVMQPCVGVIVKKSLKMLRIFDHLCVLPCLNIWVYAFKLSLCVRVCVCRRAPS